MKPQRQTISITLATYNEEANLARCLDSVKDFANEIVIVDGHSQDKTVEIAKKYGAQVLLRDNNPVFHIQKKIANDQAKSDWVLQMDADEKITPGMAKEIVGILEGTYFGYDRYLSPLKSLVNHFAPLFPLPKPLDIPAEAYWLPRTNFFLGRFLKNTGQYPDPSIRLFQRGKADLPAKDVHEQMVVHGSTGWLKSNMEHYGSKDFSGYLLRENRYSSLKAQQLKEAGIKITLFNTINYLIFKPISTFLSLYFRYRGFLDGFPGFVFSLYSGLHYAFSYMKLWELYKNEEYGRH